MFRGTSTLSYFCSASSYIKPDNSQRFFAREQGEKVTMSMTLRGSEDGGLESSLNSFSILIDFGPILPAILITCHHARAKRAPVMHIWTLFELTKYVLLVGKTLFCGNGVGCTLGSNLRCCANKAAPHLGTITHPTSSSFPLPAVDLSQSNQPPSGTLKQQLARSPPA